LPPSAFQTAMDRFFGEKDWFDSRFFSAVGWAVLFAVLSVQILACLAAPVHQYDDAIPLVSSDLVRLGRTPAIDFKSFYPPFYYFPLAAAFRITARSVLVVRFFAVALYLIAISASILFFRRIFSSLKALVIYMILPVTVAIGPVNYPQWPAFALALLSLFAYLHSYTRQSSRPALQWLAAAGALAGFSTLVRFNFGPYVAAVAATDILLVEVLLTQKLPFSARVQRAVLHIGAFAGSFAAVNLGFYVLLYGLHGMFRPWQMVTYSMRVMGSHNFLRIRPKMEVLFPLGFPCAWIFVRKAVRIDKLSTTALVPAVAAAALISLALLAGNRASIAFWFPALSFLAVIVLHVFVFPVPRAVLCLLLFYVCLQHYFLTRADLHHSILFFPIVALSFPFLLVSPAHPKADGQAYPSMPKGLVVVALIGAAYAMAASRPDLVYSGPLAWNTVVRLSSGVLDLRIPDRQRLPLLDPSLTDEIRAIEFLRQRTSPSTLLFVGVKDHSKSFINDVRAYWLSERLPGVTYINIDSGMAGDETTQREIIAELQRNHVNWAILFDVAGTENEPSFQRLPAASRALDDFLNTHFQEQARFGRYSVVARNQS
jgi:hypothetical protein